MHRTLLRLILILLPALAAIQPGYAQQFTHLHNKTFAITKDTIRLDSLTLVQGSLLLLDKNANRIDPSAYVIDEINGTLVWVHPPAGDSIKAIYRTFQFNFGKTYFNKDLSKIEHNTDFIINPFSYSPGENKKAAMIDFGTMDYNGSYARGISFGNNQDAVVNSSFNLQMSGNITPDIEVKAAITDNNIPIQPDGNTQQLQQFDKVFIQVTKKPHQLIFGDFEVGNPRGYFMKFYKNLQGVGYRTAITFKDSSVFRTTVNLAVAKGNFAQNKLAVSEGNQGPYKLTGANGESFIIILAGTEKVFVNGQVKKRGADKDYVIDYNLGEITFTPNMLITQDLRVTVEFQYSVQNYFRSFAFAGTEYDRKKIKFNLNFYSEQDSKNQPVNQTLSTDQKILLSGIGNDISRAVFPGYSRSQYDPNLIQYKLVHDSTVNGAKYDTVFVYSTNTTDSTYNLSFSYVGGNAGNYIPSITTANGRVYQWVAPVNGVPQGAYQPVVVLVTPQRKQLFNAGFEYAITKNDLLTVEAAMSNSDPNLYSSIGNKNNIGTGDKINYKRRFEFGGKDTTGMARDSSRLPYVIQTEVNYEFVNHSFKPIERYRPVEFTRDWNYNEQAGDTIDQHLAMASLFFAKPGWFRENYKFNTVIVDGYYTGYMHTVSGLFNHSGFRIEHNISYLTSDAPDQRSKFLRPKVLVEKSFRKLKNWRIGGVFDHEDNRRKDHNTDTLLNTSYMYTEWRAYIGTADSAKNKVKLEYIRRQEYKPDSVLDKLHQTIVSNTFNLNGEWVTNKYSTLKWQATYRRFYDQDSAIYTNNKPDNFYLGRLDYTLNVLKGAINTNILYQLGAGREQRIDYTYLPVGAGLGNFIWHDYNNDGKKQANEFETATFSNSNDTMYVRVLNPTNEFDAVNTTLYNQVLNLNPRVLLNNKKGFLDFVSRISTVTSLQIDRKVLRSSGESPFNPFSFNLTDTALLYINSTIRNSVFFNRTGTVYSLEYTLTDNRGKTNLTSGFETRSQREHLVRIRWNISKSVNAVLKGTNGFRANSSQISLDRNYNIKYYSIEPELNWLFKSKFRITFTYGFSNNLNTIATGNNERALNNQLTLDARYSLVSKTSLNAHFSFINVNFNGTADTPLEYAMLQGLKKGENYVWSLSFDRTIGKNIQLNLTYEGHKTGEATTVHTGRAQVRATF